MNAQDLMIGDWVSFRSNFLDRVDGIAIGGHSVHLEHDRWQPVSDLKPIPLTPEILEKNGFSWDGSGQRSMMLITPFEREDKDALRYNIYVGLKYRTIEVFTAHPQEKKPGWRKSNKVYLEVCGCCVHELQHAFRMCGLDKEIML